jgi:hypothetical protein
MVTPLARLYCRKQAGPQYLKKGDMFIKVEKWDFSKVLYPSS